MKKRTAVYARSTTETVISAKLNIDGAGKTKIKTGIGFLDHMLELFAFWGYFDLEITTKKADFKVDTHHANEDLGIVLGEIFKKGLGDKKCIRRIGFSSVPMEHVLANVTVDISGRSYLCFPKAADTLSDIKDEKDGYLLADAEHFLEAFSNHLGMNLNVKIYSPKMCHDLHTVLEPIFKALGIALDQATQKDPRRTGIPSTKGVID